MGCVHRCSDGPQGICRLIQAFVACLFLFIGIVCQFYAGSNLNDISLGALCETYSGSSELMDRQDFDELFDWAQNRFCERNEACCGTERNIECFDYDAAAGFFLAPTLESGSDRVDLLRYAGPIFWCKHVPLEAAASNKTCQTKMREHAGRDPTPCPVWPGQLPGPEEAGNWYLAASKVRSSIRHISCNDKLRVYADFLRGLYGSQWSDSEIDAAAAEFYSACIVDKGSDSFILIIGPVMALLGGICVMLTMLETFNRPPWPDIGINMLLIGAILLLVGFWSISLSTTQEIFTAYTVCGNNQAPLIVKGRWYDRTPCLDRNSLGEAAWNPFVVRLLSFDSTYIAGGVFSVLAILMFMGLATGFTEKMVEGRFAKHLVRIQAFFVPRPNLPFPSRTSNQM